MKRSSKKQTSMDKFIVRSPKKSPAPSPTKERGGLRQVTLESLRGVVVMEDMDRAVVVLERSDVSSELKVDTLQHLLSKNPAKEVLIKTGLGKTVHKLCRSEDVKVARVAQRVYRSWKKHILSKVNRPYIEVKCDLKTQRLRNSARQMLCDALQREAGEGSGGGGGGGGGDDVKGRRKPVEIEGHKESWISSKSLIKRRKGVVEEEEEKIVANSEEIKAHKTKDSDRKIEKRKQREKREEGEEEGTGINKRRQRHEEEECERTSRKEGVKSKKQKKDEVSEGEKTPKGKKQENETQKEKRKDIVKYEEINQELINKDAIQDIVIKQDSMEVLAEHIERELYHSSQRRIDNAYRRTVRALVFTLRHQGDVRKAVSLATLSVSDLVKQYRKS